MPLLRHGTSTLSMIQRKATKYQKFLNLNCVFLSITSTILIFTAIILMKFYHIDKLDFWSDYFWIVPLYMIILGCYTLLVCLFGFAMTGFENRAAIAGFAVMLSVAFLAQLGSIFTALELRTTITHQPWNVQALTNELNKYESDTSIKAKWDNLQEDLQCCGANFYTDYSATFLASKGSRVPDSCCRRDREGEDCGKGMLDQNENQVRQEIYTDGCMERLKPKMEDDVVPIMIIYAVVGVILALMELITVVLACAYVAQITRRLYKNNEDRNFRGMGDAGKNYDETDNLNNPNHETVC